jgi:hypothetical protein
MHNHDYTGASSVLYEMLLWNGDAVDYDPALIPKPNVHHSNLPRFFEVSEWSGVEWSGVEWSGVGWAGLGWAGLDWGGVGWGWGGVGWREEGEMEGALV